MNATPQVYVCNIGFWLVGPRRRVEGGWIVERHPVRMFRFLSGQPQAANA